MTDEANTDVPLTRVREALQDIKDGRGHNSDGIAADRLHSIIHRATAA